MVCAHGGDAALAPPATMRAFQAAIQGGFRCVEVHLLSLNPASSQSLYSLRSSRFPVFIPIKPRRHQLNSQSVSQSVP